MSKKQKTMKSGRLRSLINEVESLYSKSKNPFPLRDWIFRGHVQKVAILAERIAARESGNVEFVVAAAYLHDIGDVWIENRDDPAHQAKSLKTAQELLLKHGFNPEETMTIVEQVIIPHSCKEIMPEILDGKIFATADALAHFTSDFYLYLAWENFIGESFTQYGEWVRAKVERDYHRKIFFGYWRKYARPYYKVLKEMLG